jgi:hypothetical protein
MLILDAAPDAELFEPKLSQQLCSVVFRGALDICTERLDAQIAFRKLEFVLQDIHQDDAVRAKLPRNSRNKQSDCP